MKTTLLEGGTSARSDGEEAATRRRSIALLSL
jgi:hypothetical protein